MKKQTHTHTHTFLGDNKHKLCSWLDNISTAGVAAPTWRIPMSATVVLVLWRQMEIAAIQTFYQIVVDTQKG